MQKSQSQMNFSQFAFDFDFCSISRFEATETLFEPKSINLFKKVVSSAFIRYQLNCVDSLANSSDVSKLYKIQNCIKVNCMKIERAWLS